MASTARLACRPYRGGSAPGVGEGAGRGSGGEAVERIMRRTSVCRASSWKVTRRSKSAPHNLGSGDVCQGLEGGGCGRDGTGKAGVRAGCVSPTCDTEGREANVANVHS